MPPAHDAASFVAVSNTTAKICALDSTGKPTYTWQESGQQSQGSVNWLRNGKAFLTTQGGNVVIHLLEKLKEKATVVLSLPAGPLLARVSGDGKCLVLVQSGVPGSVHVYDIPALLGTGSAATNLPVTLQDHDKAILALAASPGTTHVASSNAAGSVYLHEAGSGVRRTLAALPCGNTTLMTPKRCLAFSQSYKPLRLAAGADDGQVLVWQVAPALQGGPVAVPSKLRGRVMGVGFAAFNKTPSAVLLSCSENGQLSAVDLRPFPNLQAGISVELSVSVSCMAVREDGQVVAVGTKDGRIGCFRTEELITNRQNMTKLGLIKVFDLCTHLDVVDIAFQRVSHKEARDVAPSTPPSSAPAAESAAAQPAAAADRSQQSTQEARQHSAGSASVAPAANGGAAAVAATGSSTGTHGASAPEAAPPLKEATNNYSAPAGLQRQPGVAGGAGGGGGGGQSLLDNHDAKATARAGTTAGSAAPSGTAATAAGQRHQPAASTVAVTGLAPGGGVTANASRLHNSSQSAASTGPAGTSGQPPPPASVPTPAAAVVVPPPPSSSSSQQPPQQQATSVRPVVVTPLTVPGSSTQAVMPGQRRPSEAGVGPGGTSGIAASTSGNVDEPAAASPVAARAMVASGVSPVASPSRVHSPRTASLGGAAAGGPSGIPPARLPFVSTAGGGGGGEVMSAAGMRAYLDDFRQEVRDLVHGMQADMVRQTVALEVSLETQTATQLAAMQQENRQLREDVARLTQLVETCLRFGLLGQQRGPW
ncbi:hypothetical protein Agub_g13849 [Astrephomene gubernaculifera]|uniref:Uncharacterized protein n=1 Tax=Astrephomene gubernaculifera TaxID=47775 RepID=A0AAD3HSL4_9CHLO|nr:hypothetical protein Agub_g13849 [Astrephomene gubernaculifera]